MRSKLYPHVTLQQTVCDTRHNYNIVSYSSQRNNITHLNKRVIRISRSGRTISLFTTHFHSVVSPLARCPSSVSEMSETPCAKRIRISTAPHLNPAPLSHTPSFLFVEASSRHRNHMLWTRVYKHSTGSRVAEPF